METSGVPKLDALPFHPIRSRAAWHVTAHYRHLNFQGYRRTNLILHSKKRTEYVHRLIACSFLGPPPTPRHTYVNHKDGKKSNNALENLEWTTPAENSAHYFASAIGRRKVKNCRPVCSRPSGTVEWTWHPSIASCANSLGLNLLFVSHFLRHGCHPAAGHEFRTEDADVIRPILGEEWRKIDVNILLKDRALRKQFARSVRSGMELVEPT